MRKVPAMTRGRARFWKVTGKQETRNSTAAQSAASGSRQMWLGARRVRASGMHSYVLAGDRHLINSRLKENQESE